MGFDFSSVGAPFRMQPGLSRLPPSAPQLTPLRPGDAALAEKLDVLTRAPQQALLAAPGADPVAAWHQVARRVADEHAEAWQMDDDGTCCAAELGWCLRADEVFGAGPEEIGRCLRGIPPPHRLAGLLALTFAEDLALLDAASGRVPCMAVCLPSRWVPEEKIGRHFAEIHAPVADGAALVAAAEPLVRLVTAGQRWERFVWTVTPSPRLDAHPHRVPAPAWDDGAGPDALAAAAFFRTERQTFGALADGARALFAIQVEVRPLRDALRTADDAGRLHAALASMSAAVLAYRGLTPARDRLLSWLDARRGA